MPEPAEPRDHEGFPLLDDDGDDVQIISLPAWVPGVGLSVRKQRQVVTLLSLAIFCFASSSSLSGAPMMRILEDNLCQRYYDHVRQAETPIDEQLCKVDGIQSELAYLNGLISTADAIVGLIVALPFGVLADKYVL